MSSYNNGTGLPPFAPANANVSQGQPFGGDSVTQHLPPFPHQQLPSANALFSSAGMAGGEQRAPAPGDASSSLSVKPLRSSHPSPTAGNLHPQPPHTALNNRHPAAQTQMHKGQFIPPVQMHPNLHNAPAAPAVATSSDPNYRPLNVKDALSYLDQVKIQFSDRPDVYNKFLDIMKEFKSQSIDTPGVIERVSTLFKGHTSLIVGFNTFLPPGYRIEINQDQSSFTITVPDSVTAQAYTGSSGNYYVTSQQSYQAVQSISQPQMSTSTPGFNGQVQQTSNAVKKPVEFNHAINYVNKIKNRFANEPDVYKNFLEILRTYQNESRPIGEVYVAVQELFKDSADLLEEFKQFLPEASPASDDFSVSQVTTSAVNAKRNSVTAQSHSIRRSTADPFNNINTAAPKDLRFDVGKSGFMRQYGANEEFEFFEKVKKGLGSKTTYTEFLKVLNLFNQDIIDPGMLITQVEPFLSKSPDLYQWFKNYVKFSDKTNSSITISVPEVAQARDLTEAKRSGSSYRLLPKEYTQPSSSGRDSFCYEILNDYWVCHPTWASEDGGFVAHKKNQFEDALYRCEEERYEFDLNIDANKSVIQRLEPIAKRIADMNPEEQRSFKLPDGLGDGFSKTIYKRVLKKIYDKDRGQEVIDSLHEFPSVAVPIILKRLKQKDEEWRRNQREWNKVWREVDGKNFYKSLDHQGLNFKAVDKKAIASKSLITEIETLYREKHFENKFDPMSHRHHLEYQFPDLFTVQDVKELVVGYIMRASGYNDSEQDRFIKVLDRLIENFCIPKPSMGANQTTIFCNDTIYLFFRLFQLAYTRLRNMRDATANISASPVGYNRVKDQKNSTASNLDLIRTDAMPVEVVNGDVYRAMLTLIRKLYEGDIEPGQFEEQARFWFGTTAYVIYTIDKVVHSLCKQLVHISTDPRCGKLLNLFIRQHDASNDDRGVFHYRQKADELIDEDENLYRIDYVASTGMLQIQLLGDDQGSSGDSGNTLSGLNWSTYIDNYVKMAFVNEEFLPRIPAYLKRSLRPSRISESSNLEMRNNLECKICINTYKMFFVEGSEDYFFRRSSGKFSGIRLVRSHRENRSQKFRTWLLSRDCLNDEMSLRVDKWFRGDEDDIIVRSEASISQKADCTIRQFVTHH